MDWRWWLLHGRGRGILAPSGPVAPAGFTFLIDQDGVYLTDADGSYLLEAI